MRWCASDEGGKKGFIKKRRMGRTPHPDKRFVGKGSELADSAVAIEVCLAVLQVNPSGEGSN